MALSYKDSVRNTRLDALTSALGTAAVLDIFTSAPGGKSAGAFVAESGTKLASLAMSNPTAPGSANGVLTFSTITAASALASGTPASFRMKTVANGNATTCIVEGDAAVGSGSLNFNSTIAANGTVSITSAVLTEGNA